MLQTDEQRIAELERRVERLESLMNSVWKRGSSINWAPYEKEPISDWRPTEVGGSARARRRKASSPDPYGR